LSIPVHRNEVKPRMHEKRSPWRLFLDDSLRRKVPREPLNKWPFQNPHFLGG
jgi:hypothetical protein